MDTIDRQTDEAIARAAEADAGRGDEDVGESASNFLAYVMSSGASAAINTTFRVRICDMMNDEVEGAALAGDFNPAEGGEREFLAMNVGTVRPTVTAGDTPGTLVIVHQVGDRFAFAYHGA